MIQLDIDGIYPLAMTIIAIENGPVEIFDLPIKAGDFPFIDAPCMVDLPTFAWFLGQMLVNIPNMEHMRINYGLKSPVILAGNQS